MHLAGPKMLPDRVLVLEKLLRKRFIDHRYFSRRRRVLLRNGPARYDFGTQSFEESRHHADESRSCIVLGSGLRPTFDANAVVPAIAGHRRIERRRHHAHAGNLLQAIVDLPEQRFHLLRLVISQSGIHPRDIPALRLESKFLVLQVPQALAEKRRCGEQYQ